MKSSKRNVSAASWGILLSLLIYSTNTDLTHHHSSFFLLLYSTDDFDSDDDDDDDDSQLAVPITLDDKVRLASNLFLLNGVEMTHVLSVVELQCPQALERFGDDNHVEVVVDELTPEVFQELTAYATEKAAAHKRSSRADPVASKKKKRKR